MRPVTLVVLAGHPASPALSTVGGIRALELILQAANSCRRLQPLSGGVSSVRIVLSDEAAAQANSHLAGYGLSSSNILSNGVRKAEDWQGDVTDLKAALAVTGVQQHVLVLSANCLTLGPGYNLQRLIEHGLTRNCDAVGIQELGFTELKVLGPAGHTLSHTFEAPQLVPPLAGLERAEEGTVEQGSWGAQPLLLLTPATLAQGRVQASSARDLITLAQELYDNQKQASGLHAVSLGAGVLHLTTPAALEFANKCVTWLSGRVAMPPVTEGDAPEVGTASTAVVPHSATVMEQLLSSFCNEYYGLNQLSEREKHMPPTFYMSTYRRLAADMLR